MASENFFFFRPGISQIIGVNDRRIITSHIRCVDSRTTETHQSNTRKGVHSHQISDGSFNKFAEKVDGELTRRLISLPGARDLAVLKQVPICEAPTRAIDDVNYFMYQANYLIELQIFMNKYNLYWRIILKYILYNGLQIGTLKIVFV